MSSEWRFAPSFLFRHARTGLNPRAAFAGKLLEGFISPGTRRMYACAVGLLLFLFPFSLIFIVGGVLPERYAWTASVVIILNGAATLFSEMRGLSPTKAGLRFLVLLVVLFAIELFGVNTGYPFGAYAYTEALGALILGVPLAIPFAWYATIINIWRIAQGGLDRGAERSPWPTAVVAGILTVALDFSLEPMATLERQYWIWAGAAVPLQNYVSWFTLSVVAVVWLSTRADKEHPLHPGRVQSGVLLLGMQWVLFVLTDLVNGHVQPVLVAGVLILLLVVLRHTARRASRGMTVSWRTIFSTGGRNNEI